MERAYQSVAEREISVDDEVVICVVKSTDVASSAVLVMVERGLRVQC